MKTRISALTLLGLLILPLALIWTSHAASFQVGSAEVDITPEGREVHDPLKAKAIVFRQGRTQAALVVCDVIGISGEQSTKARELAHQRTGIPVRHIAVAATHTHSGAYHPDFTTRIAEAIAQAHARLQPTELESGIAQQPGLAFNRRFLMKDGTVRFNPGLTTNSLAFDGGQPFLNPDIVRPVGPTDPSVGILLFRGPADHDPVTSLVNFSLHCCTCASPRLSADYPHFLAEALKPVFGNQFISVFAASTCGDINHFDVSRPGPQFGYETAQYIGKTLADSVQQHLTKIHQSKRASLAVRSRIVQAPLQAFSDLDLAWAKQATADQFKDFPGVNYNQRGFLAMIRAHRILALEKLRQKGHTWPLEVQAIRLSDQAAIVTLPGELFVELGLMLRKASPFPHTMIIELANESCAYIPTSKAFSEGGYEVVNSRLAPGGGEMLIQAAVDLLQELR